MPRASAARGVVDVDRRLGDLRLHPGAGRHLRDPGSAARPAPGAFAVKQVFLDSLGRRREVRALHLVGAQFYCGMSSITSASRMMYAFSRDRAVPGHQLWRKLNRERVPYMAAIAIAVLAFLCAFPAYFGTNGVGRLRRRSPRSRRSASTSPTRSRSSSGCGRATRGSRASGTSGSTTSGSGRPPCIWVAFIQRPVHPPDTPAGFRGARVQLVWLQLRDRSRSAGRCCWSAAGGCCRPTSGSRADRRRAPRRSSRGSRRSTESGTAPAAAPSSA